MIYIQSRSISKICNTLQNMKNYRFNSTVHSAKYSIVHLNNRGLIQVYGKDSPKLLQGLITNDINILDTSKNSSLYSMFLNAQGRCVYDVFLYPYMVNKNPGYLIECDVTQHESLLKYLKMYKLRSKVKFDINLEKKVYFIFGNDLKDLKWNPDLGDLYQDSRLSNFGFRMLSDRLLSKICDSVEGKEVSVDEYNKYRYENGLSEGEQETSNCIPLEHNLALINGVSFDKGCYVGQELVARTHYTGVIRKRITPIYFNETDHGVKAGAVIKNSKDKRMGKVIGVGEHNGIGLIRLSEYLNDTKFTVYEDNEVKSTVEISKPSWWPENFKY